MGSNLIHQYYYLWSVALIFPLWSVMVYQKRASRVEIIYMGILFGACAMGLDRYCSFHDYWRPPTMFESVNVESFLYGFFWGGISTKMYEWICRNEYQPTKEPNSWLIFILVFGSFFLYMVALGLLRLNSVDIYVLLLVIWSVVLIVSNRTMLIVSLVSGIGMVMVNVVWYALVLFIYPDVFQRIWFLDHLSGWTLFHVPVEEHVYIFALGCFGSIMYKVATRARLEVGTAP